jgi:predicted MFS family arabinose efflux permease
LPAHEGPGPAAGRLAPRTVLSLVLILLASMVAQSFGRFTYPVLLKAIDEDLLGSLARAGSLGTVSLAAYLIGTGSVSWLSTRLDPGGIIKIGLAVSATGLALLSTARGFAGLAVGLFVAGLGSAAVWIPAPGLAASLAGPERGGMAIGLVGSGIGLGIFVVGPLTNAVRAVAGEGAWRPVYAIETVVAVVVAVAVAALVRSPRAPVGAAPAAKVPTTVIRQVPGWTYLLGAFALFGAGYSLFFYFFVTQLQAAGWSPSSTNLIASLMGLASIVGGVVFGRLSDRLGRPLLMMIGFLIISSAPLLALTASLVPVLLAAIGFGLCVSGTPTAISAVVADHLSGRAFGAAFGSLTFAFGMAQLAGPQIAGILADRFDSFVPAFVAASVLSLAGAVCSWRLRVVTARPPAPAALLARPVGAATLPADEGVGS